MTDAQLQVFYDILGEAFKAGMDYVHPENKDGPTAGDMLFPLAARMEEILKQIIEEAKNETP